MLVPRPPAWFDRKLRETNPSLRVHHTGGPQGWQVSQMIPYIKDFGTWEGMRIQELRHRREKIIYVPELGSKVIEELRLCWGPRYRNFDDFVKQVRIQA